MTAFSFARPSSARTLFAAMLVAATTSAQASVEISSNPTHNMNCADGVCTPTAKNADLNATDLANMLAGGDVKVVTGAGAVTITVSQSFSWTSTHRLTLDAHDTVSFRAPVVVAGQGAVTITYNDGGTSGDFIFFPGAKLDFWDTSSSLTVNGYDYRLLSDVPSLAKAIAKKGGRSGAFALARDYDAKNVTFDQSPIHTKFYGRFEGLGHSIDNLTIVDNVDQNVGLFGMVGSFHRRVVLRDVVLNNANVSSSVLYGGVGTLVGWIFGYVSNAAASGHVKSTGGKGAGGLVGLNSYGLILRSHADVDVQASGTSKVGGLIGEGGEISQSYATGSVTMTGYFGEVGGLAGSCDGCRQDFATGAVTGDTTSWVGGLAGSGDDIENSYATGAETGGSQAEVGGLIGNGGEFVRNSYSTGKPLGGTDLTLSYVGGFAGHESFDEINENYWDTDTSGLIKACGYGTCAGVTGLTDVQLKSTLPDGFDPAIWGQKPNINNGYPYLLANPPPQ